MLREDDPIVQFKLSLLDRCMPAESAVVFGDVWRVDGGYTVACAERGCERVLLVDGLETPAWQEERLSRPQLDFMKGDFSNPLFMSSFHDRFDVGVAFDILLHQPSMLGALNLMLAKVDRHFCIVQPVLEEQAEAGSLVYLPGNPNRGLYPLEEPSEEFKVFNPREVNHSNWIWGITPSFLTAAMIGEGFRLAAEEELGPLANPRWRWWGAVYEREHDETPHHWSSHRTQPGLWTQPW